MICRIRAVHAEVGSVASLPHCRCFLSTRKDGSRCCPQSSNTLLQVGVFMKRCHRQPQTWRQRSGSLHTPSPLLSFNRMVEQQSVYRCFPATSLAELLKHFVTKVLVSDSTPGWGGGLSYCAIRCTTIMTRQVI